jgi:nicotinamide mononucleotide adenylyltransferase
MCKLAAEDEYNWLTVDPWEAESPTTIPTAQVLDHVDHEINEIMGGIDCDDGTKRRAKIVLLAGLDLVQTMSTPGVWEKRDLDHILGRYGLFALERRGTETESALASLKQWRHNIHILRKVCLLQLRVPRVRWLDLERCSMSPKTLAVPRPACY